jgi:hypothetical protein
LISLQDEFTPPMKPTSTGVVGSVTSMNDVPFVVPMMARYVAPSKYPQTSE